MRLPTVQLLQANACIDIRCNSSPNIINDTTKVIEEFFSIYYFVHIANITLYSFNVTLIPNWSTLETFSMKVFFMGLLLRVMSSQPSPKSRWLLPYLASRYWK